MSKDNDVTVDQVRAVAEQHARENQISVIDVTVRRVKELLKRGSDGYIGAHLQTVKIEAAHAQLFGEKQISQQLMAAIYDELKRFTNNSREVALEESAVTQQMFDEICECNAKLEETMASMRQQFTDLQHKNDEDVRTLNENLQIVQREKDSVEVRLKDSQERVGITDKEHLSAREKLAAITVKWEHSEKERNGLVNLSEELKTRLQEIERELSTSRDAITKAEQRADLLTMRNTDITSESDELKKKIIELTERAAIAEAEVNIRKEANSKTTKNQ